MPGDTLPQPLGRVVIGDVAEGQRVVADHVVVREGQIGLRAVAELAWQGEADQEAVERLLAAIEAVDAMIAPQLSMRTDIAYSPDRVRRRWVRLAAVAASAAGGAGPPAWRECLPLRGIQAKMLPVRQRFLGAGERALQHEVADRAARRPGRGVEHALSPAGVSRRSSFSDRVGVAMVVLLARSIARPAALVMTLSGTGRAGRRPQLRRNAGGAELPSLLDWIVSDPAIFGGKPIVRGMRLLGGAAPEPVGARRDGGGAVAELPGAGI